MSCTEYDVREQECKLEDLTRWYHYLVDSCRSASRIHKL